MTFKRSQDHWDKVHAARDVVAEKYPRIVSLHQPVPLKLGIYHDLRKEFPQFSARIVEGMLHWLTWRRAYLKATVRGVPRWGLDGPCADIVTDKQEFVAQQRFITREARAKDKYEDRTGT